MFTIIGADGREYGPVTAGKLQEWIAGGRANLQTRARREGEADWKTLAEFPEFAAPGSTAAPSPAATPPPVPARPVHAAGGAADAVARGGATLASPWARLGAALLDGVMSCVFSIPGVCLLVMGGVKSGGEPLPPLAAVGMIVIFAGLIVLLGIQAFLLSTHGQTIGKKIVGVKIVTYPDERNPGFVKAVLLRAVVNAIFRCVPFYGLVDICFIFRDDHRCIHDLLAGTQVVDA